MKFFAWAIAILSVNQIIWQTPNLPQMVYYAIFLLIAIVMVFYHPNIKINVCMLFFIMAIVCSIFVNYIPDYFMPWDRFFSFLMVILCVSPFLYNSGLTIFRKEIFDKVNILFVIIQFRCPPRWQTPIKRQTSCQIVQGGGRFMNVTVCLSVWQS